MPKMKSNSSIKKRFKLTATGKLVHSRANTSHNLTKKSANRKRHLGKAAVLATSDRKRILRLLAG